VKKRLQEERTVFNKLFILNNIQIGEGIMPHDKQLVSNVGWTVKGGIFGAGVGAGAYTLSKNPASEPVVAFFAQNTTKFMGVCTKKIVSLMTNAATKTPEEKPLSSYAKDMMKMAKEAPAKEYTLPPYAKNMINLAGKAPTLKMAAGVSAIGGAKLGLVSALVINGLYNGSMSNELNVAHPIVFGGTAGAVGGYYAYTKKESIEKLLPKQGIFSKLTEVLKTPTRSVIIGGSACAKLSVLAYVGYSYLHKKDTESENQPQPKSRIRKG
jgi:hypothetical protein